MCRLTHAQLMVTLAKTELHALLFNKEDLHVNVYQDGKDSFAK